MLAGKAPDDLRQLTFPLLATPKLDGIRCLVINGKAVTRTFKPIPNHHIRRLIEAHCPNGMDGEILVRNRTFNELSGDVRREDGEPDFYFAVFDYVHPDIATPAPYHKRMQDLKDIHTQDLPWIQKLLPLHVDSVETLLIYESMCLKAGYEGVMTRRPDGTYKHGRSTTAEGLLLKIKRFEDSEAVVIGYEEQMENQNEAQQDAFGRTKRSSHAENLVPKGTLGALIITFNGIGDIGIGTGFDQATRDQLWAERDSLIGRIVKFKHQPSGAAERPRFPVFLAFRDGLDI